MAITSFSFSNFEKTVTTNDEGHQVMNLRFDLNDSIEKVVGSNGLYNPNDGKRIPLLATDVVEVYCNLDLLAKFEGEFIFGIVDTTVAEEDQEFDGTGIYKGNMMLDVARSGKVWLTDVPYSKMSGDFKRTKRGEELSKLLEMHSRK